MAIPITEKLIQRQINHWNSFRKYLRNHHEEKDSSGPKMIITVSRQIGAGGRELATALAERLGLPLHDRSLVAEVMREENLPPALAAELDEHVTSQTDLWIKGLFNRRIFLLREYQHALTATIERLADSVGGVFLGRGAHLVLGHRPDLRLRVVGSTPARLQRLREREGLDREAAESLLDETDQGRSEFLAKVFGARKCPPCEFDLTINSDRINLSDQMEMAMYVLVAHAGQEADSDTHRQVTI